MAGLQETLAALASMRLTPSDESPRHEAIEDVAAFGPNHGGLRMRLHVPAELASPRSLVVVLHGCTQTAQAYAEGAGWLTLANRLGFLVLCPEQTRANNPNLCFNWFQPGDTARGGGEVASIHAMIQHAVSEHDIDPKQIFITGLSAGGAMAVAMLATYPEVFAGGAIIAGLPYGAAANVSQALSAMRAPPHRSPEAWAEAVRTASSHTGFWPKLSIWQGDDDTTVAPEAALALASQWSELHGVSKGGVETVSQNPRRRCTRWRSVHNGETVVELNCVAGMGHGAPIATSGPSRCGAPGPYLLDVGVSSSLEIAHGWNLDRPDFSNRTTAAESADPVKAPMQSTETAMPKFEDYAGRIIAETLRNVGLLR